MTKTTNSTYSVTVNISGKMSGKWEAAAALELAVPNDREDFYDSDIISFLVIPDMNTLRGMEVAPSAIGVISIGREMRIEVLGAFEDGYNRMIQNPALGTTYSVTGEPGIVSVSPEGVVKALKVGKSVITVRNGKLSATLNMTVTRSFTIPNSTAPDPQPD